MDQFYSRTWYARAAGARPPDYPPHPQWSLPPVCHQPQDLHQYTPRMEHPPQPPAAHHHPHPSTYNKSYTSILSAEADFSKGLLNLRNVPDNMNISNHPIPITTTTTSDGDIQIQRDHLNLKLAHASQLGHHLMTPAPIGLNLGVALGGGGEPSKQIVTPPPPVPSSSKVAGTSKKKRSKKQQQQQQQLGMDGGTMGGQQGVPLQLPRRSSNFSNESFGSEDDDGGGGSTKGGKKRQKKKIILHGYITVLDGTPPMYQCNVCQKKFKTKAHVKYHEFCQKGEKPFKCEQCGQGFIVKGHYEYHLRTHTGEKPFTCPKCNKGFSQSGQVTRHMRSHSATGEKPFTCTECNKGFFNAQALRSHKLVHSGDGGGDRSTNNDGTE